MQREREKKNRNYGFFIRTRNRNYRMIHSVNHSFELAKGNNIPESNHVTFARRRCVIFRIHFSRISDIMLAHAEGNVQQAKTNKSGFVRLRALQSLTDTRMCVCVCVYTRVSQSKKYLEYVHGALVSCLPVYRYLELIFFRGKIRHSNTL